MRALLVALMLMIGSQAGASCGVLCGYSWWRTATANDVQAELDGGAYVMAKQRKTGKTPLHLAAILGGPSTVQVLLNAGADVNARDGADQTPLHNAANSSIVQVLLAAGADVNARDGNDRTPLHNAANLTIIQALLAAGADVNARDTSGNTPLYSIDYRGGVAEAQALLDAGANLNVRNLWGRTPLVTVTEEDPKQIGLFMLMVGAGANLDTRDYYGNTRLHDANFTETRLLVEAGANVNALDYLGETKLHKLINYKNNFEDDVIELAQIIIDAGANLEITGPSSVPLLSAAVNYQAMNGNSTKIIELLIASGANVNSADKDNYTPIMYAARVSDANVVKLLLDAGADVTKKNTAGRTAWDSAQRNSKLKNTAPFWSLAEGSGQCGRLCGPAWWQSANEADLQEILNSGAFMELERGDFDTSFRLLKEARNLAGIQAYWALTDAYWALNDAQYN